jgi:hypothetical protein
MIVINSKNNDRHLGKSSMDAYVMIKIAYTLL